MKARSITTRNMMGGFLGGLLGILGFGYHPTVLPLGCVFGVLVGWWYQEILKSAVEGWYRGMRKTQEIWDRTVLILTTPTKKLKSININLGSSIKIIHFLTFPVVWIFRSPIIFYQWIKRHPMNQVHAIRFFAVIVSAELTALWMIPVGFKISWILREAESGGATEGLIFIAAMLLFITAVGSVLAYPFARSEESMRDFYTSWSLYSHQRTIPFFFREVAMSILFQMGMLATFSGVVLWLIAVGGAFVILIIAPLSFVIGMVKGIYKAAMRPGHWLCLITTLTVSLLSVWQMHSYFADVRILWVVALATGVASAIATEGMRQLLVIFYEHNEFIKKVAIRELSSQLTLSNKAFWRLSRAANNKYLQPMQLFCGL